LLRDPPCGFTFQRPSRNPPATRPRPVRGPPVIQHRVATFWALPINYALNQGNHSSWTPAVWKSCRLPRVVNATLSDEASFFSIASGMAEWVLLLLAEALGGPFDLRECAEVLKRCQPVGITDCKSLFDHLNALSSPTAMTSAQQ
jgi:hypothetical protein